MTSTEWEQGSVLDVSADGAAAEAVSRHVPQLVQQGVASAVSRQDGTLWIRTHWLAPSACALARSSSSVTVCRSSAHDFSNLSTPSRSSRSVTSL